MSRREGQLRLGLLLALVATALRVAWALAVPTIPVGDFAMYRESANYLVEHGTFDSGFVYMPGLVLLLAALQSLGGEITAAKLMGAIFGGLAAAPLFLLTARIADDGTNGAAADAAHAPGTDRWGEGEGAGEARTERAPQAMGAAARARAAVAASPAAFAAGVLYALWPAGISLGSVVGTDVPAAAMLTLALALLVAWGPRRPLVGAVAFGAVTGLAAYLRAVALPLTVLSAGYWFLRGVRLRQVVLRTALSVGVTLTVLAPWAIRNVAIEGELSFTDHHGGVTALMGNYPNTEGTYARSLQALFKDLTGRTFLSQPHHEADRLAYGIAKAWMKRDPAWTAGMIGLRLERLFAAEHGLLYWSLYRPGVLPAGAAAWFARHRGAITMGTDVFYLLFVGLVGAGLAFSIAEKRWVMMVPIGCAAILAGTYALFVAEPRYRVTTEVLLFPAAGFGLRRLIEGLGLVIRSRTRARDRAMTSERSRLAVVRWRRGAALTALVLTATVLAAFAVVAGGRLLRERHRWAVTLWRVDGHPYLAGWRSAHLVRGRSSVSGTADGVRLELPAGIDEATADVTLAGLTGAPGSVRIRASLDWSFGADPAARVAVGSSTAAAGTTLLDGSFDWRGGPASLPVRLIAPRGGAATDTFVVIRDVVVESTPRPP